MSHLCDETYDVYQERIRKARKLHTCAACKLTINPGDYYCSLLIVFEGTAKTIKRCGACQKTHEHLREVIKESGCSGEMWPDEKLGCGLAYEDEWGDVPDEIAALAFVSDAERGALLMAASRKGGSGG